MGISGIENSSLSEESKKALQSETLSLIHI